MLYKSQRVKVGDVVRITVPKETFSKQSPNFSKSTYIVDTRDGYSWKLRDSNNHVLRRRFKDYELQIVNTATLKKTIETPKKDKALAVHAQAQKLIRGAGLTTKEAFQQAAKGQERQAEAVNGNRKSGRTTRELGKYSKAVEGRKKGVLARQVE